MLSARSVVLMGISGIVCLAASWVGGQEPIRFADVTDQVGLRRPLAGMMGHGAAVGDFDGDGRIDLFVGGFCDRPDDEYRPASGPVPSMLFRNLGPRFERTSQAATRQFGRTSGALFADWDNDGTLDLYVANNAKLRSRKTEPQKQQAQLLQSRFLRNEQGLFRDVTQVSGGCPTDLFTARNVGALDYDGDGLLDLLVVEDRFRKRPSQTRLLRNLGGFRFQDVTAAAGLSGDLFGLGLAIADVNGDLRPDIFVAHSNRLFLSGSGGRYREHAALNQTFAWDPLNAEDWPCGAQFADLNRDGQLDLVLSIHHVEARNRVYLNQGLKDGVPQFRDVSDLVGLKTPVPARCPHVEVQDFDNDGWPDIFVSAAWQDKDGSILPLVYRHQGIKNGLPHFAPPRPIAGPMVYFPAGPTADFDNDGRRDLFLVNWFAGNHCRLMRNTSTPAGWLDIDLRCHSCNQRGLGAEIRLFDSSDAKRILLGMQPVTTGYGYASGQTATCHFGLGDRRKIDVEVRLPNGKILRRSRVPTNQKLTIKESAV